MLLLILSWHVTNPNRQSCIISNARENPPSFYLVPIQIIKALREVPHKQWLLPAEALECWTWRKSHRWQSPCLLFFRGTKACEWGTDGLATTGYLSSITLSMANHVKCSSLLSLVISWNSILMNASVNGIPVTPPIYFMLLFKSSSLRYICLSSYVICMYLCDNLCIAFIFVCSVWLEWFRTSWI